VVQAGCIGLLAGRKGGLKGVLRRWVLADRAPALGLRHSQDGDDVMHDSGGTPKRRRGVRMVATLQRSTVCDPLLFQLSNAFPLGLQFRSSMIFFSAGL